MQHIPVLIVGGSLVGLSSAVFLRAHGVPVILVEPHVGSHPHPRAIGYTPRTMELFRSVGLADAIPEAPRSFRLVRRRVESLAGEWLDESAWTPATREPRDQSEQPEYSPTRGAAIAQDRLEPILRRKAIDTGAELRLGTELVRFEQDDDGVTAWLRERDGEEYALRADYLIAADGSKSPVREALGISRSGRGHIRTLRSVLFRAPLDEYLASGVHQFEIEQPGFEAFLTTYNDGRWVLMFPDDRERDETELRQAVERAIGRSDLPIELITTGRWELTALIADAFTAGRVFLAGDAAHTLPPTRGGYGANTGIQDAHNLAWKLAAVLAGKSSSGLLDTYDAERRPVAWERLLQTFARPDYAAYANGIANGVTILDDAAIEFGQLYRSPGVLGASANLPPAARPDEWNGQPGTRAPHLWITVAGERRSTLDLFGHDWVLLTLDPKWRTDADVAGQLLGIVLETRCVGEDVATDTPLAVAATYGIGIHGASLVRPDGYIAWRAADRSGDPAAELQRAVAAVSFRAASKT